MRRSGNADLAVLVLMAGVCGVLCATVSLSPLRIGAGLILELLLPGYALCALVFDRRRLSQGERVLVALGGSLIVSALGGLLLDALPGHMGRIEWASLLVAVTLLAVLGTLARPAGDDEAEGDVGATAQSSRGGRLRTLGNCLLALIALALAVGAVLVARHAADKAPGFTELSALPTRSGSHRRLAIEVKSHEFQAETLNLAVREDGRLTGAAHVLLGPGQAYHRLTRPLRKGTKRVAVVLTLDGSSRPYLRTVYYPHPAASAAGRAAAKQQRPRRGGGFLTQLKPSRIGRLVLRLQRLVGE